MVIYITGPWGGVICDRYSRETQPNDTYDGCSCLDEKSTSYNLRALLQSADAKYFLAGAVLVPVIKRCALGQLH